MVRALRTRLSYWRRVWGCCSSSKAVAFHVVAPTQTRRQQPTRARSTEESRLNGVTIVVNVRCCWGNLYGCHAGNGHY